MVETAAIVVLYHPDAAFISNIQSYIHFVQHLYIADNSETKTDLQVLSNSSSITYLHTGENKGIAFRLNEACNLALKEGYKWMLTMDQDSFFDSETLRQYLSFTDAFPHKENVAMFGLENDERQLNADADGFIQSSMLITSGSIINLSLYHTTGGFNEQLFIDLVDVEYCLKAIKKGFDIIKFNGLLLHHNIGETTEKHSIKTLKKTQRSFHSPVRFYYMFRNYLFLKKQYGKQFPEVFSAFKKDLLHRLKNTFLYTGNKFISLRFLSKAFLDYKRKKMGKIS